MERTAFFHRIGALRGEIAARHNIGYYEYNIGYYECNSLGNHEIGIRHWKIAAEAGYQSSLDVLKDIYIDDDNTPGKEFISKEYLDFAYRACHAAQMLVKSEEREKYFYTDDESEKLMC